MPFGLLKYGLTKTYPAKHNFTQAATELKKHYDVIEVDPEQPRISASWFSRFRHYNNLDKCEPRLRNLMSDFQFTTTWDVISDLGLNDASTDSE